MRAGVLLGVLVAAGSGLAAVGQAPRVAVVELFTSEGCSSCPPADALLRRVNGKMVDGVLVVGIGEHVTYWNQLGWRDPYSSEGFSERQEGYVRRLGGEGPYTPEMVVNGRLAFVGSDENALRAALETTRTEPRVRLEVLGAVPVAGGLRVRLRSESGAAGPLEVMAALKDEERHSAVLRGENGGRTLEHAAVARTLGRVGTWTAAGEMEFVVPLPAAQAGEGARRLVVFLQRPGQGAIVGAAVAAL